MSTLKTLLILGAGYAAYQYIGGKKHNTIVDPLTNTNVVYPDITYYGGYEIKTFPAVNSFGYSIFKNGKLVYETKGGVAQTIPATILMAEASIDKNEIPTTQGVSGLIS